MVTRDDVAREAGVSTAVVSYVVNNGPRKVAEPTRLRVLAAIEDLGYRPNRLAGALGGRRSRTLGFLFPNLIDAAFTTALAALTRDAEDRDFAVVVGNADDDRDRALTITRRFIQHRVDGVILARTGEDRDVLDSLEEAGIPTVVLHDPSPRPRVATVGMDEAKGAALAVQHLVQHGHTRIGCLAGRADSAVTTARMDGFRAAVSRAGFPVDDRLLVTTDDSLYGLYTAARDMLSTPDAPTALVGASDSAAVAVLRAAPSLGLRVPSDVALIGVDGSRWMSFSVPGITTIERPLERIAHLAFTRLDDALSDPLAELRRSTTDTLAPHIRIRGSCGCPDTLSTGTQ